MTKIPKEWQEKMLRRKLPYITTTRPLWTGFLTLAHSQPDQLVKQPKNQGIFYKEFAKCVLNTIPVFSIFTYLFLKPITYLSSPYLKASTCM